MKIRLLFLSFVAVFATLVFAALPGSTAFFRSNLSSTAVLVVTKPHYLAGYNISNPNSGTIYVQCFDAAATSDVTVGSTTPTFTLAVPGNGVLDGPTGGQVALQLGLVIAATTTATGSTAPTTAIPTSIFTQ